ncbi:hypothetical protein A9W99_19690 [Mycobacterium sp. 1164966.3]|nr:hypothetical protein A9W99_19690 [Mycobacterium sp. 1164966.3]
MAFIIAAWTPFAILGQIVAADLMTKRGRHGLPAFYTPSVAYLFALETAVCGVLMVWGGVAALRGKTRKLLLYSVLVQAVFASVVNGLMLKTGVGWFSGTLGLVIIGLLSTKASREYFQSPAVPLEHSQTTVTPTDLTPTDVVRPSRAFLLVLIVLPVGLALLKATTNVADSLVFLLVLVSVCIAGIALYVMYVMRTGLGRSGNDLVFTDWLGRQQVIPLADIDRAVFVRLRAGEANTVPDKRLLLRRRSGAPPLMFRVGLWKTDQIVGFLNTRGIAVNSAEQPMSAKKVAHEFPGARFSWSDRHPVLLGLGVVLVVGAVIAAAAVVPDLSSRKSARSSHPSSSPQRVANSVVLGGRELLPNSGNNSIVTCRIDLGYFQIVIRGGPATSDGVYTAYWAERDITQSVGVNFGYIDGAEWSTFAAKKESRAEKNGNTYKVTGSARLQRYAGDDRPWPPNVVGVPEKPFTITATCP